MLPLDIVTSTVSKKCQAYHLTTSDTIALRNQSRRFYPGDATGPGIRCPSDLQEEFGSGTLEDPMVTCLDTLDTPDTLKTAKLTEQQICWVMDITRYMPEYIAAHNRLAKAKAIEYGFAYIIIRYVLIQFQFE
jgi:hypothetical protein